MLFYPSLPKAAGSAFVEARLRALGSKVRFLGDAERSRWVTLRARWVTLRARWVTLRARWVTLRARWVTLRARWVTCRCTCSATRTSCGTWSWRACATCSGRWAARRSRSDATPSARPTSSSCSTVRSLTRRHNTSEHSGPERAHRCQNLLICFLILLYTRTVSSLSLSARGWVCAASTDSEEGGFTPRKPYYWPEWYRHNSRDPTSPAMAPYTAHIYCPEAPKVPLPQALPTATVTSPPAQLPVEF
jgi:hypothetical protein